MHTSLRSLLALFVLLLASAAWAQQRSPGYLGAELQDVTKEEADKLGWEAPRGAKVVRALPDSPAAEAGLAPGDVITALDGVEVENFAGLRAALDVKGAGTSVKLRLLRSSRERTITGNARRAAGGTCRRRRETAPARARHGRAHRERQGSGIHA